MKKALTALALIASASSAFASVTLTTGFGVAYNSTGAVVPDGTLWALVVDTDGNSTFAGGFGLNSSLTEAGANTVFIPGQTLSVGGLLAGDAIFAMGSFNGNAVAGMAGLSLDSVTAFYGTNGLAAGKNIAFYWFPGATAADPKVGTQVGGFNSDTDAAALGGMVLPADGANVPVGGGTADLGGTLPNSRLTAVNLVPETSTALLGALGALGLLRRRR